MVYSQGDSSFSLYLNSSLASKESVDYPTIDSVTRLYCYFGEAANPLNAYLDDVMFFSKALSAAEVKATMNYYQQYTNPPATTTTTKQPSLNPTHMWNFDGNLADKVTHQVSAYSGNLTFMPDRFGRSMASAYLAAGGQLDPPNSAYITGTDFSSSFWIMFDVMSNQIIFWINGYGDVYISINNAFFFSYINTYSGYDMLESPFDQVGQWVHVGVTWNKATMTHKLYVNGSVVVKNLAGWYLQGSSTSQVPFSLKGEALYLDDVMLFTRALSDTEMNMAMAYKSVY